MRGRSQCRRPGLYETHVGTCVALEEKHGCVADLSNDFLLDLVALEDKTNCLVDLSNAFLLDRSSTICITVLLLFSLPLPSHFT
jgi:hypothetical protein